MSYSFLIIHSCVWMCQNEDAFPLVPSVISSCSPVCPVMIGLLLIEKKTVLTEKPSKKNDSWRISVFNDMKCYELLEQRCLTWRSFKISDLPLHHTTHSAPTLHNSATELFVGFSIFGSHLDEAISRFRKTLMQVSAWPGPFSCNWRIPTC